MRTPAPFTHGRYRVSFERADRYGDAFLVDRETIAGPDHHADGVVGSIRVRPDPDDHRRRRFIATLYDRWAVLEQQPGGPPPLYDVVLGYDWTTPEQAAAAVCDAADQRRAPRQLALPLDLEAP